MKLTIIRIVLLLILLGDLIFIWSNSAQNASESSDTSKSVTEKVASIILPNYEKMDDEAKAQAVASLDSIVREAAHLLQFTPIGFSLYLLLNTLKERRKLIKYKLPITVGFGLAYAVSDEVHQIFSPGRAFELFDIFMDTAGTAIGCMGAIILLFAIKTVQNRTATKSVS